MIAAFLLLLCFLGHAAALDTIQYGDFVFSATFSIANQLGFFTRNGLNVVFNQVNSSTQAFDSLLGGQFDILIATVDNALNNRFNLNQNVTVLGQLDQGPGLVLASVPSITNVSQLQGKSIIVDSPLSGYSFLLQFVLSKFGLELVDGDFTFITVGGTNIRFADLLNGSLPNGTDVFATILTYPFTIESQTLFSPSPAPPNILARVSDFIAPITSSAFTIRQSSLANATEFALLARFLAAMHSANEFLLDPSNKACSVRAIALQLEVTQDIAEREYASATDTLTGEVAPGGNFTVTMEGIENDVMVRQMFNGFGGAPEGFNFTAALEPGSGKLIDYSVRDAALQISQGHGTLACDS
ncbi:unnamed protein product [Peniophora sp. CBMAI 1063]|nr:unnamed protein product [Peniophora sp. CBMAI 1063]